MNHFEGFTSSVEPHTSKRTQNFSCEDPLHDGAQQTTIQVYFLSAFKDVGNIQHYGVSAPEGTSTTLYVEKTHKPPFETAFIERLLIAS